MDTPERPLADAPLYQVQGDALKDDASAREAAIRYADKVTLRGGPGDRYFETIVAAYLRGLHDEPDPYKHGRGGNFAANLRRAWRAGRELRELLTRSAARQTT